MSAWHGTAAAPTSCDLVQRAPRDELFLRTGSADAAQQGRQSSGEGRLLHFRRSR
jgi:hypothetical protein